jgi:hypothetical protein
MSFDFDEEPERRRYTRAGGSSSMIPGLLATVALLATIACLIASSHFWNEAWRERDFVRQENRDRERRGEMPDLQIGHEYENNLRYGVAALVGASLSHILCCVFVMVRSGSGSAGSAAVSAGALGAMIGGLVSLPISQYAPLFGGVLGNFAEPWSVFRLRLVPIHFGGVAVLGAILFGVIAGLTAGPRRR